VLLAVLTVSASGGCSALHTGLGSSLEQQAAAPVDPKGMVVVELRREEKREFLRAPVKENMLVQDALKGSGAISRFHRMNIVLVRQTPDGKTIRLPVKFDVSKRQVAEMNNYAIYGGDTLEVTQDNSTTVDRMFSSWMQPIRSMTRTPGVN
jgi:hypothetical protein